MHDLRLDSIRSVLCLGAHADDIEIGAGGTLLRLIAAQPALHVHWIVFSASGVRAAEAQASADEFLAAAEGSVHTVDVHGFADGFFPSDWRVIKQVFETLKHGTRSDLVLTHHRDDRHQDHRTIAELTWNTFRDELVLEYEIPKFDGELGQPNIFVPIGEPERRRKLEILTRCYASQREKPWFTAETFDALMRLRGVESRSPTGYAEAFHGRKIRVTL
jgi:LmbE family N-acetylglucosaminyl deacetylase